MCFVKEAGIEPLEESIPLVDWLDFRGKLFIVLKPSSAAGNFQLLGNLSTTIINVSSHEMIGLSILPFWLMYGR